MHLKYSNVNFPHIIPTGNGDLIRCYQCGIGLKDWGHTDDPLTEHVRYSPSCQYIIDVIPPTMLRTIKVANISLQKLVTLV